MKDWWFALPTATAILAILYPDEFTVYDWRACEEIKAHGDYKKLANREFSDTLWADYQNFIGAVRLETPDELSLRDKDRFLMARSYRQEIERHLADR